MSISAGLVGLPNVGKSTLFNALTKAGVPAENYPFCTIDPHVACTIVPDKRIAKLFAIYKSPKHIQATVEFVDIAGLVKGAASGEGLGNQFLSHIRETNLILHVLRCFSDLNIISTQAELDPVADYEIIMTELMLKDLESVQKRIVKVDSLAKQNKHNPIELKELLEEKQLLSSVEEAINKQNHAQIRQYINQSPIKTVELLSSKESLFIANISEEEIADDAFKNNPYFQKLVATFGADRVIPICARLEYELSTLSEAEAADMAEMFGLKEKGLETIIEKTYNHLGLITFFTCGPKEIHAWPIKKGITVRAAAGEIHSDLERGFICAEVFNAEDLFIHGSEQKLKEIGKIRTEGQEYIVRDGDILNIRFNV